METDPGVWAGFTYRGTRGDPAIREQREREIAAHDRELRVAGLNSGRWTRFRETSDGTYRSYNVPHTEREVLIRSVPGPRDDWMVVARNDGRSRYHGPFDRYRSAVSYARQHRNERSFWEQE
jgi:hypothetical protein